MLFGSCEALIFEGLYASALTRRETPSQFPVGELNVLGISSRVDAGELREHVLLGEEHQLG